jgi:hypothetical protein
MSIEDLKKIQYNADIFAKDLKDGMKIIDEDDCDKPDAISYVFEVSNVVATKEKITFRAVAYGRKNEIIHDFTYDLYREPEEPIITVFFESIKEGLSYGLCKDIIQTT